MGDWGDRDVFQFYPRESLLEMGLRGSTVLAANALGPTSAAYLSPVVIRDIHADGYPLCEGRKTDRKNPPVVLLPNRAALAEWCTYAARYRTDAYERAWREDDGADKARRGSGWSFFMRSKRRNLHCAYLCTYLDELGVGCAFDPCAFDDDRYYIGYYAYGLSTVVQQWKNKAGKKHLIVPMNDAGALADVVDLIYGWYDGGPRSITEKSLWR